MKCIVEMSQVLWDFHTATPEVPDMPADVVVGLGSYDETVAYQSVQVFRDRDACWLLFSGDRGNWTRDLYKTSEAEHFGALARQNGISDNRIIIEGAATNIGENVRFSEACLQSSNLNIVFVTKPQTRLRLYLTLLKVSRSKAYAVSAPQRTMIQAFDLFGRDRIVNEMVGDLDRIEAYPQRGFSTAVSIPPMVNIAKQRLLDLGYDSHCLHD